MVHPTFHAHNVLLDNGSYTMGAPSEHEIEQNPFFQSAKRMLNLVYPQINEELRIADLGALEGGYSVGFARMGFHTVGIEIRQSNYDACMFIKENVNLPGLHFYKDDVWNIHKYGDFDAIWCSGLLYHLDEPRKFLEYIASCTRKILFLQTHFAPDSEIAETKGLYGLSRLSENEGLAGRWYREHDVGDDVSVREKRLWSSYENNKAFWLQKAHLLDTLRTVGFDVVLESYDCLAGGIPTSGNIVHAMLYKDGYYRKHSRGLFVGIKAGVSSR